MTNPNKYRLRRTMMFLNCRKPGLIKDPYIYKPDSRVILSTTRSRRSTTEALKESSVSTGLTQICGERM